MAARRPTCPIVGHQMRHIPVPGGPKRKIYGTKKDAHYFFVSRNFLHKVNRDRDITDFV